MVNSALNYIGKSLAGIQKRMEATFSRPFKAHHEFDVEGRSVRIRLACVDRDRHDLNHTLISEMLSEPGYVAMALDRFERNAVTQFGEHFSKSAILDDAVKYATRSPRYFTSNNEVTTQTIDLPAPLYSSHGGFLSKVNNAFDTRWKDISHIPMPRKGQPSAPAIQPADELELEALKTELRPARGMFS